ncbi:MAG: uroporphyrinogen decarboxylase [Parachlamydia sp.]|nr:uroporphyrinogen decarboxylase [Parachlamydia sp.]
MESILLQALQMKNRGRPPVWLMRQAGRYLPQFRALREKYGFLEMCHQPELAVETTLLPIQLLGFDAAILFSDILVIAEALGVGLRFEKDLGPIIERPLSQASDVDALPRINVEEKLGYVAEAIRLLRGQLKVPLIGFCGAPFTLASYLIEGGSSRDLKKTKRWMLTDPESFHQLLRLLSEVTIAYLKMQIKAGAQAIQIFDSWASALAYKQFREFSLNYMKDIVEAVNIPSILFCRGSSVFASQMAEAQPDAISIDWNADLSCIRRQLPNIALQGNLDPDILHAPRSVVEREVRRLLDSMRGDPGYIFNLGHGITPEVPVDNVKALIETVKSYA